MPNTNIHDKQLYKIRSKNCKGWGPYSSDSRKKSFVAFRDGTVSVGDVGCLGTEGHGRKGWTVNGMKSAEEQLTFMFHDLLKGIIFVCLTYLPEKKRTAPEKNGQVAYDVIN